MKLKVYEEEYELKDNDKIISVIIDAIEELNIEVYKFKGIEISNNEIMAIILGREVTPISGPTVEDMVFYFDVKNQYFNNGGDEFDVSMIDWKFLKDFYKHYANDYDMIINAIDDGDLEKLKELTDKYPKIPLSMNDSFYARRLIMHKNIELLKWAVELDPNIDFSSNNLHSNTLKLAINHNWEDGAIWLLENFKIDCIQSFDALGIIKLINKNNMSRLLEICINNKNVLETIINNQEFDLLPNEIKSMFVF